MLVATILRPSTTVELLIFLVETSLALRINFSPFVDKSDKDYKNISFTKRIKLSGAGSESARAIAFKTAGESKVKIYATSSDTDTSRLIKIIDKNGNDVTSTAKIPGSSLKSVSFRLDEAGEYYIVSESGGVNIYYVEVSNGIAY